MRDTIIKVIKIALACALVFLIAAPLIVGVYDAYNGRDSIEDSGGGATGFIRYASGGADSVHREANDVGLCSDVSSSDEYGQAIDARSDGDAGLLHQPLPYGRSSQASGDSTRQVQGDYGDGVSGTYGYEASSVLDENSLSVADWYSGDTRICDLFRSSSAHLVYDFADGSTVDFGNPYILDWADVSIPDDYDSVVASSDESLLTFIAPEKAYAGPISWLAKKLNYLAVKSGYWKSFNNALYSLLITGASAMGMSATEASAFVARCEAAFPEVAALMSKEGCVIAEEDAAMVATDIIMTATQRGYAAPEIVSKLPQLVEEEAASVNATGQLLGGGSSNFMNAMYQLLAENQVSAEFLMSNADFFTTFFSWLGADLTSFDDLDLGEAQSSEGTLTFGDHNYYFKFANPAEMLGGLGVQGDISGYLPLIREWYISWPQHKHQIMCVPSDAPVTCNLYVGKSDQLEWMPYIITIDGGNFKSLTSTIESQSAWDVKDTSLSERSNAITAKKYDDDRQILLSSEVVWNIYDVDETTLIAQLDHGRYSGELPWTGETIGDSQLFSGQIVGAGAQYDEAGNITDYGNVTVPNVFVPDYVAPGTYAEALNQMNATATQDSHATANSPAFGQSEGTTVKDWTETNKPTTPEPGTESGQDDFKVEDLEKVFPFCIPWDLYYLLSSLVASPVAPQFTWTFDFAGAGQHDFAVDLSPWEPVAQVLRVGETLLFCVGLVLVTRDLIRG